MYENLSIFAGNVINGSDKDLSGVIIASVVFTGMIVVFLGLVFLVAFVTLYGKFFEGINKRKAAKAAAQKAGKIETAVPSQPIVQPVIEDGVEEEVVAVIISAISAMSAQSGKKLVLKSVKTAKPQRNAWASAAANDYTRPF